MGPFLIILIIVGGYFICLGLAMSRSDSKQSVSALAVIVMLVYSCVVGMFVAVRQYLGELGLVLYAAAIIYSCLYWGWKIYRLWNEKPQIRKGILLTLGTYLLAVLYITTFMRKSGTNSQVQMFVMNWLFAAKESGAVESFDHVLLNVAMFVPIGVLFPLAADEDGGKFISAVSFGMLVSVIIETGQLIFHYGTCDIDDIISNTVGTAIGALIVMIWQKGKRSIKDR